MGRTLKYVPLPMYYGKMLTVLDITKLMGSQTNLRTQLLVTNWLCSLHQIGDGTFSILNPELRHHTLKLWAWGKRYFIFSTNSDEHRTH